MLSRLQKRISGLGLLREVMQFMGRLKWLMFNKCFLDRQERMRYREDRSHRRQITWALLGFCMSATLYYTTVIYGDSSSWSRPSILNSCRKLGEGQMCFLGLLDLDYFQLRIIFLTEWQTWGSLPRVPESLMTK